MSKYVEISKQIELVRKIIAKAERSLTGSPEGYLRVCKSHGTNQFYYREDKHASHGRYLRKSDLDVARRLAQKEYDCQLLRVSNQLLKELLLIRKGGAERSMEVGYQELTKVYDNCIPAKRELIKPHILPDEMFVQNWLAVEYSGGLFAADAAEIYSERGERVRSKSEKILADKLMHMGIPYRYEYPTKLKYLGQVFTDFTLLDVRERQEVKYEHFGMMQDPVYCNKAIVKIEDYEKSGYHLGENFLFTMESEEHVLDTRHFERLIRQRFMSDKNR